MKRDCKHPARQRHAVRKAAGGLPVLILLLFGIAGCRTTAPAPPPPHAVAVARLAAAGQRQFAAGAWQESIRSYRAALDAAMQADAAGAITRAAAGLAVSLAAAGQYTEAVVAARLAQAEARPATAEYWTSKLIEARVAWLRADCDATVRLAGNVWLAPGAEEHPLLRVEAGILLADAALKSDDPTAAAEYLRLVRRLLADDAPPVLRATLYGAEGRYAGHTCQLGDAAAAFDREAALWRDAGRYREMALALEIAGDAWQAAGDLRAAADRFLRAGRSLHAAGTHAEAWRLLGKARETADSLPEEDPLLLRRIKALPAIVPAP